MYDWGFLADLVAIALQLILQMVLEIDSLDFESIQLYTNEK